MDFDFAFEVKYYHCDVVVDVVVVVSAAAVYRS